MAQTGKIEVGNWIQDSQKIQVLIDEFSAKLTHAQAQVERYDKVLHGLLSALEAMQGAPTPTAVGLTDDPTSKPIVPVGSVIPKRDPNQLEPEQGRNRDVIAAILTEVGHSVSVTKIARRAFKEETIKSASGYRGVYSTVSTTLKRNSKHLFVRVRRGLWDLRARRNARIHQLNAQPKISASVTVKDAEGKDVTTTPNQTLH